MRLFNEQKAHGIRLRLMATETTEEVSQEIKISDDRDLYRSVGRIEGRQEVLLSIVRDLRVDYRALDAKITRLTYAIWIGVAAAVIGLIVERAL